MQKLALALIAALALPTMAFATAGTPSLSFTPLSSTVASPGSSVTLTLGMNVTGFSSPDAVGGFDIKLTSLNSSTGFFIQSRTTNTNSAFPDPITPDATVANQALNPTNTSDLGQAVTQIPANAVGNGTYSGLSSWVIGVNSGVAPGTYNFTTSTNIWTDQTGGEHTGLGAGTFSLTVVPEPATWSLLGLGGIASFGLNFIRARRRIS